ISHKSDLNSWNERFLCWTEDNRLQAVKDNKMGAYYNYDAAGERNLKLTGGTINIIQNGQSIYAPVLDQQTLYASALVTVNDKGYTKHYFEEGKRICSKIGSGELQAINDWVLPIQMDYPEQRYKQIEGIKNTYDGCMGITPYIKNKNLYETIIKKYEIHVNSSEPAFFYHSDHLGSASYITDSSGIQTQQLVYLPFGEDWVDKKYNVSQFQTPYKFNGKEKDEETGYNYYGARYYYDWASIWLSVDPMSDKYPSTSSYAYCRNNPIMLVDPDGRDDYKVNSTGHITRLKDQSKAKDGVDRLIKANVWGKVKYNEDGSPKGNSIEVEKGTFKKENFEKGSNEGHALYLDNNRDKAEKIFSFLADNTDVEYSLIERSDQSNIISTSHVKGSDDYGSDISKVIAGSEQDALKSHIHNHSKSSDPSRDNLNGSDGSFGGDLGFKRKINEISKNKPEIYFGIYIKGKTYKY
ncbi:MAG: type secretion protein Rhs, partial [Bacteroidetes bacterium]|nr:type secretion protein Rhs [Bacteroidota bacterium]